MRHPSFRVLHINDFTYKSKLLESFTFFSYLKLIFSLQEYLKTDSLRVLGPEVCVISSERDFGLLFASQHEICR